MAVLDHLADALIGESTLVLGTTRVEGALTEVLERLVRRDPSSVLPVAPLEDGGVDPDGDVVPRHLDDAAGGGGLSPGTQ